MKREPLKYILPILLLLCCRGADIPAPDERDASLVVPGKSAEGYIIGEELSRGEQLTPAGGDTIPSLSVILGINSIPGVDFDSFIYFRNRAVIFTRHNVITAIAGLGVERRVTESAVKLSDGSDSFILNYGNSGMEILREGQHWAYIYRRLGIAIFDDYGDDSIDMYLVFAPTEKQPLP